MWSSAPCSRRWFHHWTQARVASSTWSAVRHGPWGRTSSALYKPLTASARALMPLCQGAVGECGRWAERVADLGEDLAGDVALEQPQDLFAAGTGGGTAGGVRAGLWVVHEPVVGDDPQGAVWGGGVAAVGAVGGGLAAGMLDRAHAAQRRERALAAEPVRVVAGGHQQLRGADRADPGPGQQPGHHPPDDGGDVLVVV